MRLKYLIVLPLAVLSVIAFAHPEVVERMDELSVVRVGDLLSIQDSTSKKRNKMGEEERKRLELRLNLYGKERAHKWKLVEETQAYKDYIEIKNKVESIEEYKGLLDQWRKKFPNTPHSYYHFGGPPSPHIFRPTDFDKHLLVHGTTKLINDFLKLKECEKRLENTTEMKGYRTTKAVSYIARDKDNIFVDNDKTIN